MNPESDTGPDTQLESVQRWFQSVISHPEGVIAGAGGTDAIDQVLTSSNALDAAGRLSVYANAYFARLIECMGEVFPVMRKFLGEETFDSFAFEYLQEIPSRSYTLHHLGREFPGWLEKSRPRDEGDDGMAIAAEGPDWPELLVDLARLEWAVYETFDGPGSEGRPSLQHSDILARSQDGVENLRLIPSPSLNLFSARFPVNDFYTSLRRAAPGEEVIPPDPAPCLVALHRRGFVVHRYEVSAPAHAMLEAILAGSTLGEAIDAAAALWTASDEELGAALQNWLQLWAREEYFTGIVISNT